MDATHSWPLAAHLKQSFLLNRSKSKHLTEAFFLINAMLQMCFFLKIHWFFSDLLDPQCESSRVTEPADLRGRRWSHR